MAESHDSVVKRHHKWSRWLGVGAVVVGLFLIGGSQVRVQVLTEDVAREAELRQAQQCVAQYDRVKQLKDLGAFIIRTNAETLLAVSEGEPRTPEQQMRVNRFNELVQGDIEEAENIVDVVNPCDLDAAKALLETERGDK